MPGKQWDGPLRYMLTKERRNREVSSSDEEFKRINQPSYAGAWVCYNNVGINIIATKTIRCGQAQP